MGTGPGGPPAGDGPDRSTGPTDTDTARRSDASAAGKPARGPRVARLDGIGQMSAGDPVADLSSAGAGGAESAVAGLDDLDSPGTAAGPPAAVIPINALRARPRADAPVADLAPPDSGGAGTEASPAARVADLDATGSRRRRRSAAGERTAAGPTRQRAGSSVDGSDRVADPVADEAGDAGSARTRGRRRNGADGRGRRSGRQYGAAPGAGGATADEQGLAAPDDAADGDRPAGRGRGGRSGAERSGSARSGGRGPADELDPDADPVAVAREICLRLLTDRARTRHELAQALRRKGVPDDAADQVLGRFDEVGLIDDAAFAGQWVRSRHRFRGLGRRAIAMELRRKGVADEIAGEALAEVDGEAEEQRARQLVDRKLRSLTVVTPDQRVVAARRLVGMLARKGYPAGVAYAVVRAALAAHGAEDDELGGEPPPD